VDAPDWHGIRPGVRNLLQTRDEKTGVMRNVFEWDTYAAVQLDSNNGPVGQEGVRMAGTKAVYSPTKALDLKAQGEWDTEENTMAYVDLSAFYKVNEKFRLGGGYLARDHALYDYAPSAVADWNRVKENLIYAGFTHDINDTWSWSSYARWDLLNNQLDEVGGYIQYRLDCLVFQLRSAYINNYQRLDQTSESQSDFRVGLLMWLRAENRTQEDDWLTW
jgi:hypothetical protein